MRTAVASASCAALLFGLAATSYSEHPPEIELLVWMENQRPMPLFVRQSLNEELANIFAGHQGMRVRVVLMPGASDSRGATGRSESQTLLARERRDPRRPMVLAKALWWRGGRRSEAEGPALAEVREASEPAWSSPNSRSAGAAGAVGVTPAVARSSRPVRQLSVQFLGDCRRSWGDVERHAGRPLGFTPVIDRQVQPRCKVDCDAVLALLHHRLQSSPMARYELELGKALARVLAHESFHILANTAAHSHRGIAQRSFGVNELLNTRLVFTPEDWRAMFPPPTLAAEVTPPSLSTNPW